MTFFAQELIRRKRDGGALAEEELRWLVQGITDGSLTDGQAAAFAMAVFFRDLEPAERVTLTQAMRDSGSVLSWDLDGPVLDKHSTGGVGDKVSLILAPLLAACGALRADDLGPRPRPHRRHARQARRDPRLRLDARTSTRCARSSPTSAARSSARPPTSPPPTAASTRCATPPAPSSRSR